KPGRMAGIRNPMVDKLKKIWLEGELVNWDDAKIHVLTHTMHYGLGAFEGIRAYKRADGSTTIFRLKEHIERLFDSCKLIVTEPRFTKEQIQDACSQVLVANGMDEGYIRPLVYVGDGAMGVFAPDNPIRTFVVAWKWGAYLGTGAVEKGVRAKISSWCRHHLSVSLAKGKIMGQYTNSTLAKREARMGGYDEAILMDTNGYVSEGSGENLFIVKKGKVYTPPLSASILAGITRDTVLTIAREEGLPVAEEMLTRDQLYLADECFFTGTAVEITPIREVDNRKIGDGTVGPITRRLQERYFDIVKGSDTSSHPEWLTRVR
ncbi:MAG TPA: branched-chain amino acid transaminase, partial [Polyangiaceae bacterium]|nr:branched-chain amino acid transaminase [Polyangiaceae bacterium]